LSHLLNHLREVNFAAVSFAASALALGAALQVNNGFYSPYALALMTVAFILCLAGVLLHRAVPSMSGITVAVVSAILVAGIAWQLEQLFTTRPGFYLRDDANLTIFRAGIVMQAVCIACGVANIRPLRRLWFPALLAVSTFIGIWMVRATPDPYIDVVEVHREAIEALIHHRDPYRISFANIYETAESRKFYNPEAVIGGRLAQAYPYPPPSLLLAVPGHVLLGDYRYSELALLLGAAALIGFAFGTMPAMLAASVLLTTPRVWFVIEEGWSEPVGVFLLALTVVLMKWSPIAAGWAAGIFAMTKQYFGVLAVAMVRLIFIRPRQWPWIAFGVIFAAAAVTLPFALWHPNAFMRNVIWLQTREPFRGDSLSYLAWAASLGMGQGSFFWAIGAGTVAVITTAFATRNTPEGFAASVAMTTFSFFAFGSKAFCNYYFFVIGALCCAIAALPSRNDAPSVESRQSSVEHAAKSLTTG
jgi:hypothetical protein